MKRKMIWNVGRWVLYAAVLTGLAYSVIVVTAPPALAFNCTPSECSNIAANAENICLEFGYGNVTHVYCPINSGDPGQYEIHCQYGIIVDNC
jgi:hypothetical protein